MDIDKQHYYLSNKLYRLLTIQTLDFYICYNIDQHSVQGYLYVETFEMSYFPGLIS